MCRCRHDSEIDATTKPPFRADHVGSLLRSAALKEARAKRERGEIDAGAAEGGRGPRDRERSSRSRKRSASSRSPTANTAARPGRLRFPRRRCPASRPIAASARSSSRAPQPKPMMLRVTGKLGDFDGHPMIEHFKFVAGAHQADAEDDDPVAVVAAFPLRPRRGAGGDLSGHGRFLPRSRPDLPQGGARLRRRRLPLSAARRGQPHLSVRSEAARSRSRDRGDDPGQAAARSTPA